MALFEEWSAPSAGEVAEYEELMNIACFNYWAPHLVDGLPAFPRCSELCYSFENGAVKTDVLGLSSHSFSMRTSNTTIRSQGIESPYADDSATLSDGLLHDLETEDTSDAADSTSSEFGSCLRGGSVVTATNPDPATPHSSSSSLCSSFTTGPSEVDYARVAQLFELPIKAAAVRLGVSLNCLKKMCRSKMGIRRWPHRKLSSLDHLFEDFEADSFLASSAREAVLQRIVANRADILAAPNTAIDALLISLRREKYRLKHALSCTSSAKRNTKRQATS